jgi:hypothetical protein
MNSVSQQFEPDFMALSTRGYVSEKTNTNFGLYMVVSCSVGFYLSDGGYARSLAFSFTDPEVWANATPKCEGIT